MRARNWENSAEWQASIGVGHDAERYRGRRNAHKITVSEIETLLPWYAAGTLRRSDRQRVEDALRRDPGLAFKLELAREELAETIHLNETLGAPPREVADRLMAAIDAETQAAGRRAPGAAANWLTGFFASLSPRTLAVAASFAVLAIGLQSVMLVDVFTRPQTAQAAGAAPQAPVYRGLGAEQSGSFAMVRFAREANAADITNFLRNYQAAVVDGPTSNGFYRVRVAMTSLDQGGSRPYRPADATGPRRRGRGSRLVGEYSAPETNPPCAKANPPTSAAFPIARRRSKLLRVPVNLLGRASKLRLLALLSALSH